MYNVNFVTLVINDFIEDIQAMCILSVNNVMKLKGKQTK